MGENERLAATTVDPTTKLLEKRRQMFEVQEALETQKTDYSLKMEAFRRREEALRRKDLQLQESLIKFNKFLQENESKRLRATVRAEEEERISQEKQKEIDKLELELTLYRQQQSELLRTVQRYSRYGQYLEQVLKASEEFVEIPDLLNRFQTLKSTNESLLAHQHQVLQMSEEQRATNLHYFKQTQHQLLRQSNIVANYQKRLEAAEEESLSYQGHFDTVIWDTSNNILQLGQILVSVDNLLHRCQSKEHGKNLKYGAKKNAPANEKAAATLEDKAAQYMADILAHGDIKEKGIECITHLDDIQGFMADFKTILDNYDSLRVTRVVKTVGGSGGAASGEHSPRKSTKTPKSTSSVSKSGTDDKTSVASRRDGRSEASFSGTTSLMSMSTS